MGALPPMHKPLSDPEHIASILCSGKGWTGARWYPYRGGCPSRRDGSRCLVHGLLGGPTDTWRAAWPVSYQVGSGWVRPLSRQWVGGAS